MPVSRALDLAIQICQGVGYAHRANLVHCDVKPHNILISPDDRVKVADFGIARAISEASQQIQGGEQWGTPQYFSPEQAAGELATPASDVYSIGIILFEMLTGRLPFVADSQTALALMHIRDRPPLVTEINPAVPEQLALIVDKVLSKEPRGRYRTAGQLGRILSSYRESGQAETGPFPSEMNGLPASSNAKPPSEQTTQVFPGPQGTVWSPAEPFSSTTLSGATTQPYPAGAASDWLAVGLGVLAVIALLGLIPLWYFVYVAYSG
jgi:serine/threonine-protein kinase